MQKKRKAAQNPTLKKLLPVIGTILLLLYYLITNWGDIQNEYFGGPATPTGQTEGNCQVHFIDVGQGDCILIRSDAYNILIDAGEIDQGDTVVEYLQKQGIRKLDLVIATHPHSDHIGGMPAVLTQLEVDKLLMPRLPEELVPTNSMYKRFLKTVSEKKLKATASKPGMTLTFGGGVLTVLGPIEGSYDGLNSSSLVCRFEYGGKRFLFTGDAESDAEKAMLQADPDALKADVLKVGHHGSKTSTKKNFYAQVDPDYCILMLATGNDYGHPHDVTMKTLETNHASVYRTDLQGSIVMTVENGRLAVSYEKQVKK